MPVFFLGSISQALIGQALCAGEFLFVKGLVYVPVIALDKREQSNRGALCARKGSGEARTVK
ncbi:hypothetical protein SAMN05192533_103101 [Mesobacillus persicus]|uniref:Uncharacterized protein n=1 Tax=Mesobacillus persicus TaxID=930146 RepID=A0A1H7YQN6_9BACI|nr:hypothetical protein SAMN05192533_103101 [Mesobacillus persicus]